MIGFIIAIHIIICILLIGIILIQAGRGGGLVEGFTNVESMFGTKTNALLTKSTGILSTLFFITCLTLALLSVQQSKSIIRGSKIKNAAPVSETKPVTAAPAETLPVAPAQVPQEPPAAAK